MQFRLDFAVIGAYANPHLLADLAREAETARWDGFFIWDGLLGLDGRPEPNLDPWITMVTTRLRIGAFMTPLPRRRP